MGSNNAAREIAGRTADFREGEIRRGAAVRLRRVEGGVPRRARARAVGVDGRVREFRRAVQGQPADAGRCCSSSSTPRSPPSAWRISSMMKTAEQASLVSIYLVGFQLPLSGAVLALPKVAELDHASLHRVLLGLVRLHPDDARHALLRSRAQPSRRRRSPPRAVRLGARLPRRARAAHRLHGLQEFALGVRRKFSDQCAVISWRPPAQLITEHWY